jgi:hypothetical protein
MTNDEFKLALRQRLRQIPLEERKRWDAVDLFGWWLQECTRGSDLSWEGCPGDASESVPGMCKDIIGLCAVS